MTLNLEPVNTYKKCVMILYEIIFVFLLGYIFIVIKLSCGLKRLKHCSNYKQFSVSIIVAAKNEETSIANCMQALMSQDYPQQLLEIICVDDCSDDQTNIILKKFENHCSRLKIIRIMKNETGGKKYALSKAIAQATGEILLFTDADCEPPPGWAKDTVACFQPEVGMVIGYSPLIDRTDSLIGKLIYFDSLVAAIIAAAGIGLNFPITCSGRNMAYRKQVFHDVGGYSAIMRSLSGDDDLFLHQVHQKTAWNIQFNRASSSFVPSYQRKTAKQFYFQKRRHISAGKFYPLKLRLIYALMHGTSFGIYFLLLYSTIAWDYIAFAAGILGLKILSEWYFINKGSRLLNIQFHVKYFLVWNLFYAAYHLLAGPAAFIGRIEWRK